MPVSPTNKPRNKKPPATSGAAKEEEKNRKIIAKIRLLSKKRVT